jgi:hypothetical protein
VKARLLQLEAQVNELENQLGNALDRIGELIHENETLRDCSSHGVGRVRPFPESPVQYSRPGVGGLKGHLKESRRSCCASRNISAAPVPPEPDSISRHFADQVEPPRVHMGANKSARPILSSSHYENSSLITSCAIGASSGVSSIPTDFPVADNDHPEGDCLHLPPPQHGESTMTCRAAYEIIKDQAPEDMDLEAVRARLKPGFRRAVADGAGCRVETNLLFALIDYITSLR